MEVFVIAEEARSPKDWQYSSFSTYVRWGTAIESGSEDYLDFVGFPNVNPTYTKYLINFDW
jgi:hypothetical protein